MKSLMKQKYLSLGLSVLMAAGLALPAAQVGAAGTGSAGSGNLPPTRGTYMTDDDNLNNNNEKMPDPPSAATTGSYGRPASTKVGDLDVYEALTAASGARKKGDPKSNTMINKYHPKYPFEFNVDVTGDAPTESAYLLVRAFDVDEEDGEWDKVYTSSTGPLTFSGSGNRSGWSFPEVNLLGALSGNGDTWNTSVFKLDPAQVKQGDFFVGVSISHNKSKASSVNEGWETTIDWAQLVIDGGIRETGEITGADIAVTPGKVTVNTGIRPIKQDQKYWLEVNVIDQATGDNLATSMTSRGPYTADEVVNGIQLSDSSIKAGGNYTINVILFDDQNGVPKKAEHIYSISTNDPKVSDIAKSGSENTPVAFTDNDFKSKFLRQDGGANGSQLTKVKIMSLPADGTLKLDGSNVTVGQEIPVGDLGKLEFHPAAGWSGSTVFSWNGQNTDGYAPIPAKVTLTIAAVNDAPVAQGEQWNVDENGTKTGKLTGTDADQDPLTYKVGTKPAHGTLTLQPNGQYTYKPAAGYVGSDSFTFTVNDGTVDSAPATVTITVNNVNDAPVAQGEQWNVDEDGTKTGKLTGTDADQDPLTYKVGTQPTHGTLTLQPNGQYTYKPDANYYGPDSFTFLVNDGQLDSAPALVTITVNAVNDAPVITLDGVPVENNQAAVTVDTYENKSLLIPLSGIDIETATSALVQTTLNGPAHGTLQKQPGNGGWLYTPSPDYSGPDSFDYKIMDEGGLTAQVHVQIIVKPVNGQPVAVPQTIVLEENTTATIVLSGSDRETVTGLVYSYVAGSGPQHGTLSGHQGGGAVWTYTPQANFTGTDSFRFTATDEDGLASAPAEIKVVVQKSLEGWVGQRSMGDTTTVYGMPGQPLKLSAVSGVWAKEVWAVVNGETVALQLINGDTFEADGYKKWENTAYKLPVQVQAGEHSVTFQGIKLNQEPLAAESAQRLGDNGFRVVASTLKLTANPDKILGDGKSTTELTAKLTDGDGKPLANVEVVFSAQKGTFVEGDRAVTNAEGLAVVTYKSDKITGVDSQDIPVKADVQDPSRGLSAKDQIVVTFQPATVSGVITKGADNKPVAGAVVTVTLDMNHDGKIDEQDFVKTVVTAEDGSYSLPVPRGDERYEVSVTQQMMVGGVLTPVTYKQTAEVGTVTGSESENFESEKTVTGIVLSKQPDGESKLLEPAFVSKLQAYLKDAAGNYVLDAATQQPKAFPLADQGVFHAEGLAIGDYSLELRYVFQPGQEIVVNRTKDGKLPVLSVSAEGELNISEELIDPYGEIRDARTLALIEGAHVVLYYADTQRNRDQGVQPGAEVVLPLLPGFAPNQNANPQNSDNHGFYAYMVFPQTDYYLVVTKNGYDRYTSPTISVEWDIVRHDLKLHPQSSDSDSSGGYVSAPMPDLLLSLSVDRNLIQPGGQSKVSVQYGNSSSFTITDGTVEVTLPEGVQVIDAAGGKVEGGKIRWSVSDMAAGAKERKEITLQWPGQLKADMEFDLKGSFKAGSSAAPAAEAKSSAKVTVSGEQALRHERYILGYPDGTFKADNHLTRAELAAIIARLLHNDEAAETIAYNDVPDTHWAADYIRTVTKHQVFNGFEDGTFRPEAQVKRGELAVVMARFLQLDVSLATETHFTDGLNHWAGSSIESLYRGKFLTGYPDGTFKPDHSIIRSEAVTMINRMLFRGPLHGLSSQFPDMPESHWAYGEVQEATVSHEAVRNSDGSEQFKERLNDQVR
ncbi:MULTISPECIES: tandem-95 repeat protein [unclassified Paenibacillus]|uniref:tandem-95 repeat protein n=1 Tax=unclassified Paenibacillus TaxID=185978 RepID=UPI002108AB20|nr:MULTISPECIES: Ig-like domain-containing protein [unclassified Paenibacillus]